jgi:hypothetical protein
MQDISLVLIFLKSKDGHVFLLGEILFIAFVYIQFQTKLLNFQQNIKEAAQFNFTP